MAAYVTGTVHLALYKGNIIIQGRTSPYSLYAQDLASFGESTYDHKDATGFINLYGLPVQVSAGIQIYFRLSTISKFLPRRYPAIL